MCIQRLIYGAICILAIAAGTAGCAAPPGGGRMTAKSCGPGLCAVNVTVTGCVPVPEADVISVKRPGADSHPAATIIRWVIVTPGYVFTDDGVHFKNTGSPIVERPGRIAPGDQWQIVDTPDPHAAAPVDFEYRLQVTGFGATCTGPDPIVHNE